MDEDSIRCVAFDCDGVLVDSVSSWRTVHEYYGTDNSLMLAKFLAGEISDEQFMKSDIALLKKKQARIHRDDIFRTFSGIKLMPGAKRLIQDLRENGVYVAIISAGVDLFVSTIASMLDVDDWIANGFKFDEEGWLTDEGIVRLSAWDKATAISRMLNSIDCSPEHLVSVGDSVMDLSMRVKGSRFIGFNPARQSAIDGFEKAGVPVVMAKDIDLLRPYLNLDPSGKGN
jgi:phosphoserine phosphatase